MAITKYYAARPSYASFQTQINQLTVTGFLVLPQAAEGDDNATVGEANLGLLSATLVSAL